eukprot:3440402-Prymnesium_polylepis.2
MRAADVRLHLLQANAKLSCAELLHAVVASGSGTPAFAADALAAIEGVRGRRWRISRMREHAAWERARAEREHAESATRRTDASTRRTDASTRRAVLGRARAEPMRARGAGRGPT